MELIHGCTVKQVEDLLPWLNATGQGLPPWWLWLMVTAKAEDFNDQVIQLSYIKVSGPYATR